MDDLGTKARLLMALAKGVRELPMHKQPKAAGELFEELGRFLVELAERVDAITPYLDETDDTDTRGHPAPDQVCNVIGIGIGARFGSHFVPDTVSPQAPFTHKGAADDA